MLFVAVSISAQKKNDLYWLLQKVGMSANDSSKVNIYNKLSKEYTKLNSDSALFYHRKAIELAKKLKYKKGLAIAYKNKAELFIYIDNFDQARTYLQKSEMLFFRLGDTIQIIKLNFLKGNSYSYEDNYDSAIFFYEKSNYYAQLIDDKSHMAKSYKAMGKTYWYKGEMAEALKCYKKSLPLAISVKDTALICVLYNNLGTIHWGVTDYENALNYYYLSLSLRDSLNDKKGKSLTLNNIGIVFTEWDKDEEALKYYKQASTICKNIHYPLGIAYSYYNMGNHYLKKHDLDSAITSFKLAMINYADIKEINGISICYAKIGNIYEIKGDFKQAMLNYSNLLTIADSVDNLQNKASAFYHVAHLQHSMGNLKEALKYVQKSNQISEEQDYKNLCQKNYELLADIHKKKRNYKKALKYYELANQYKDSIFNEEKSRQITQMDIFYKTEQKEQENLALKKEQEKQAAQLAADKSTIRLQNTVVLSTIVLLLVFLIFTIIVYRDRQKLKTANNTINKLFSIIGHDLRGPLGNFKGLIDLLLMEGGTGDPDRINSLLKMMQKSASSNYDLLENLLSWSSSKRRKVELQSERLNLQLVIDIVIEHYDYAAVTKSIKLITKVDKDIYVFADEKMLQTILRNLVSNALKFTDKDGQIIVQCRRLNNTSKKQKSKIKPSIEISVSDTGTGIAPNVLSKIFSENEFYSSTGTENEKGTGLGLKLCKEFVEKHGGKIHVESTINKGSNFIFTIPEYLAQTKK
jgi:signal transduction histidine kinase